MILFGGSSLPYNTMYSLCQLFQLHKIHEMHALAMRLAMASLLQKWLHSLCADFHYVNSASEEPFVTCVADESLTNVM